jgi:hypothetical protein
MPNNVKCFFRFLTLARKKIYDKYFNITLNFCNGVDINSAWGFETFFS